MMYLHHTAMWVNHHAFWKQSPQIPETGLMIAVKMLRDMMHMHQAAEEKTIEFIEFKGVPIWFEAEATG